MKLDHMATAVDARLIAHDVLDSTNAEALRLARAGERGPLWVVAKRQTAGRGRRGRSWISEPGNLCATLLLTEPGRSENWPQLSFVAALATHDAIAQAAAVPSPQLTIKWPNDILLEGAKVAGVLIEGEGSAVAVGIGVNCCSHPTTTEYPAADLAPAGLSAKALMNVLVLKMLERLTQWKRGAGFSEIRADWLDRAAGLGEEICARLPDRELTGRFDGLDPAGGLLLRLPTGDLVTVAAGDVFLRTAAPAAAAS
jgi:BirA family transcriptional regulator, biotin operon repressor / biotin---[acetyl-CoA-carboxylase] ligase